MSRLGERTDWHNTSCPHWDIRRFATIPGLVPEQVPEYPDDEEERSICEKLSGEGSYLWHTYKDSSVSWLATRFSHYDFSLSALTGYRRVSLNFDMKVDDDLKLRAYASPGTNQDIYLSAGIIFAVEEASQILFSGERPIFFNEGFDLWRHSSEHVVFSLAQQFCLRDPATMLRDYSHCFDYFHNNDAISAMRSHLREAGHKTPNLNGLVSFYSQPDDFAFLHLCFSRLPLSSTRQAIADEFSALSTTWMIAHEDAHRYLGHLQHFFENLGASLLDDFLSEFDDPDHSKQRRSSELEADSAAMQRHIDFAYDVEFIGMIFDSVDPKIRQEIWQGRLERDGLGATQRNFALRFIIGSAVVPILLFELSRMRTANPVSDDYPPLFVRFLNLAFETFNRTIAVQHHQPHYQVGDIRDPFEVYNFFSGFLADLRIIYEELTNFCVEGGQSKWEKFPLGMNEDHFFSSGMAFEMTRLVCEIHRIGMGEILMSPHIKPVFESIKQIGLQNLECAIVEFLNMKKDSLIDSVEVFSLPRKEISKSDESRLAKIGEDLRSATNHIDFLGDLIRGFCRKD